MKAFHSFGRGRTRWATLLFPRWARGKPAGGRLSPTIGRESRVARASACRSGRPQLDPWASQCLRCHCCSSWGAGIPRTAHSGRATHVGHRWPGAICLLAASVPGGGLKGKRASQEALFVSARFCFILPLALPGQRRRLRPVRQLLHEVGATREGVGAPVLQRWDWEMKVSRFPWETTSSNQNTLPTMSPPGDTSIDPQIAAGRSSAAAIRRQVHEPVCMNPASCCV
jgi:hypothetical protein